MKVRNFENRLARLAALAVLLGVPLAAENALADEETAVMASDIHEYSRNTIESADEANIQAAVRAAASLAFANRFELDIKLENHTSTLVAKEE